MNILYIWDADYPWDVRVEKICFALMQDGHRLHVASRNLKKQKTYEVVDGLHVHRLPAWRNSKLNYFLSFPLFCSPIWKRFLDRLVREQEIDLVIVRDLPLAIAGIWTARRARIPAIFDMAEDYVSLVRDIWEDRKFQGLNLVVRNPYLAKLVERYTFKHVDEILVVVAEAIEVVVQGGGERQKTTIVGNTPDIVSLPQIATTVQDDILLTLQSHYSVIYTGGVQMGRGIQLVFEAIPEIVAAIPDFRFAIVGDGYATQRLKALSRSLGVDEYVIWVGWVPHEDLGRYISSSKIGVVPHYTSNHVNTTIPNKIYDYMNYGLPVLASDAIPMKRLIDAEQCGKTFASGNSADLARALVSLRGSEERCGSNGRAAVQRDYNWDIDKARLLALVSSLRKLTLEK